MTLSWEDEQHIRSLAPHERREIVEALFRTLREGDEEQRKSASDQLGSLAIRGIVADVLPIEPLVDLIRGSDARLREVGEYALAHTDGRSMPMLLALLMDPTPGVRSSAAKALAHFGDAAIEAAPALCRCLLDDEAEVRNKAAFALGLVHAIDETSVLALVSMAKSPDARNRAAAMYALGNLSKKLSEDGLRSTVQQQAVAASVDPDPDTRWGALYVMQSLASAPDIWLPLIERALRDSSPRVQEMAVSGLKELAPRIEIEPFLPALISLTTERFVGGEAIELLGQIGPCAQAAISQLLEIAAGRGYYAVVAAKAIWRIARDAALVVPVLEREFEDNGEAVCDVIHEIGNEAASLVPKLLDALGDDDYYDLQWAAADALGAVASDDPATIDALGRALGHSSGIVAGAAARALGTVGVAAIPMLVAELAPPFTPRAEFAAVALSRMGPVAGAAADALRVAHRTGNQALRTWAAIALAHVAADVSAVPDLISILEAEDDEGPKRQAIAALAAIGGPASEALAPLRRALEHWDSEIVAAAEAAISAVSARWH